MQVVPDYSPKSFAVYGNTKPYAASLKALGGSFNYNLRGQPGYIFSNRHYDSVVQFVDQANAGVVASGYTPSSPGYVTIPAPPTSPQIVMHRPTVSASTVTIPMPTISKPKVPLKIYQYGDDAIAVLGETKPYRKNLKDLGGQYRSDLEGQPGWIFAMAMYEAVDALVNQINAGRVPAGEEKEKKTKAPKEPMQIYQYTDDTIAVLGDTYLFKEQMKALGGKYSKDINGNKGWIFAIEQYPTLNQFVTQNNAFYFQT